MSRSPTETALRHARTHGVPFVHREGPLVVLVLWGEGNPLTGEQRGEVLTWQCASAGLARAVEARALVDLVQFADHPNTLAVSVLYAEAARRRRGLAA